MRGLYKEKRNSHGKDPRTFDENSQGGDLSTPEGPRRTFKEPVERWRVLRKRKEKQWRKKKKKDKKKNVKYQKKQLVEKGERKDCKAFCGKS